MAISGVGVEWRITDLHGFGQTSRRRCCELVKSYISLHAIVFPCGQCQIHHNCASVHSENRTFACVGHKQKRRNGDDGQERGQCIPNWNGPKHKDHDQTTDAVKDPRVIPQDTVGCTSGAAPIVNGELSNRSDNKRIHGPENQGCDYCLWG